MESIKRNWKIIVILLLGLFSVSKCTQSCNRASDVSKVEVVCDSLRNQIATDEKLINSLKYEINARDLKIESLERLNTTISKSNQTLSDVAKDAAKRQTSIRVVTEKDSH